MVVNVRFRTSLIRLAIALSLLAATALTPAEQPPMQCIAATVEDVVGPLRDRWRADALVELYGRQDWRPAWLEQSRGQLALKPLIELLQAARAHGLNPEDYHLSELQRCVGATRPEHLAKLDVLMTDAVLRYSQDMRTGATAFAAVDRQWHYDPPSFDPVEFIESLASGPDPARQLAALPPPHEGYLRLSEALLELQRRRAQGLSWRQIPDGPVLRPGDRHRQILILRERLAAEDIEDLPDPADAPDVLDAPLVEALKRAQRRFGLIADGVLGPATRRALNTTLAQRIEQVRLNMDRWRWLPDDPGARYILVNLARFRLDVIENGVSVMSQKVIVGKPYLSTPAFSDRMTYLVFNPYWEIPPNLGRRSVVPKQLENPDYFIEQDIQVLTGWEEARQIPLEQADLAAHMRRERNYRLRQAPGPNNALGKVKFMFPNPFNVYLHDTPDRELFERDVRSFSSGCVRVERPLELAQYILRAQGWSPKQVEQKFESAADYTVALDQPLPVYLGYWTAWVDDDGRLVFAEDIYNRDEQILATRHQSKHQGATDF